MSEQLSEHQAPPKTVEGASVHTPTKKERKALQLVDKLFSEAKKHRSKYDHQWLDYYKFFRGKQWPSDRPPYRHSEIINFVFQQIQSTVPILTDRQPKIGFIPTEPNDRALGKVLNKMIDHDWKRNNWNMSLIETLYDMHFYGTAYGQMEGMVENGIGKIDYTSADPFYCFPDPESTSVNKKGRYFIYAEPMSMSNAKRRYPKIAKFIKPDLIDLVGGSKTELGSGRYQTPTDKYSSVDEGRGQDSNSDTSDQVLVIKLYLKDDQVEEIKEDGKVIKKKKFPKGRLITVVGRVVASDGEYPYEDFLDRFAPFSNIQNYVLPREFFGISEVEQLKSPQMIFNKMVSFTLDVMTLTGNPVWIIDTQSGIEAENLVNRPGLVIEKERGTEVRRESGTQLQPYIISMIDRMQSWFNDVAGQTDVTAGAVPTGVTAARAITAVQEAARTRLRLKAKLIDMHIQELGQMYLSRMFQFYSAPRVFRITNDDQTFDFFKVSIDESEDGGKIVRLRNLLTGEEGQTIDGQEQIFETQGQFDVSVSTSSGLPFAKFEQIQQSFQLYDRQAIDLEALLNDIDYPNKEAVIERMKEQVEAQMMAQQQEQMLAGQVPQQ